MAPAHSGGCGMYGARRPTRDGRACLLKSEKCDTAEIVSLVVQLRQVSMLFQAGHGTLHHVFNAVKFEPEFVLCFATRKQSFVRRRSSIARSSDLRAHLRRDRFVVWFDFSQNSTHFLPAYTLSNQ
mmetsp:Transcript_18870/g.38130  ORF Transcript_18870/g.38130 Transcript_18870/m.38130 type:complete len:126 (-) Transcript_18870:1139-1516(-)